jgi:nucleotide-binding universal stress UspA family protein
MYKKILLPLDGSPLSECALEHGKAIARALDGEVILFMAFEPTGSEIIRGGEAAAVSDIVMAAQKEAEAESREYLSRISAKLSTEGLKISIVVMGGPPADEILKYSKEADVDLIVMSTHGRSGLSRFLAGSVARKVIDHSVIPVLIVPASGCRNLPPPP